MRLKNVLSSTLALVLSLVAAPQAEAGIKGKGHLEVEKIRLWDLGTSLKVTGVLEGLTPYEDVKIKVIAIGDGIAKCITPGGNAPPGQNPVEIEDVTVKGFKLLENVDKEEPFKVTTGSYGREIQGAPDCPSSNWTEKIVDIRFRLVKIIVKHDDEVLKVVCKIDLPSTYGPVPEKYVSCSEDP